jgi:hypothetical protein
MQFTRADSRLEPSAGKMPISRKDAKSAKKNLFVSFALLASLRDIFRSVPGLQT